MMNNPMSCQTCLIALEHDPLKLDSITQAHLDSCLACREAQVWILAQSDLDSEASPRALSSSYFNNLAPRIVERLPHASDVTPTPLWHSLIPLGVAATLMISILMSPSPSLPSGLPSVLSDGSPSEDELLWVPTEAELALPDFLSTFDAFDESIGIEVS